jgi:hypothetical protein
VTLFKKLDESVVEEEYARLEAWKPGWANLNEPEVRDWPSLYPDIHGAGACAPALLI